jgi:hypothetical protein
MILSAKINNLPYFETPLPPELKVTMTDLPSVWSYKLPRILDKDGDKVKLKV